MRCTLLILATFIAPVSLAAQRIQSSVDAGGISLRSADSVSSSGAFISSALSTYTRSLGVRGRAGFSQFSNGSWYVQGGLAGSLYSPKLGPLLGELGASYAGSVFRGGGSTGDLRSAARLHVMSSSLGAWLGGGAARSWNSDVSNSVLFGDAGAWLRVGALNFTMSATPYRVSDSTRFVDAQLFANLEIQRLQLASGMGFRRGDDLPVLTAGDRKFWWSTSATLRVSRIVSLVATVGTYPVDFTQGFPGGRYASLGLRLPSRVVHEEPTPVTPRDPERAAAMEAGITNFSVRHVRDSLYQLRVESHSDSTIEMAGDFTAWQPLAMERDNRNGKWWVQNVYLKPGEYQVNLRLRSGKWIVPPGLMAVKDEFGGAAGLLIVAR